MPFTLAQPAAFGGFEGTTGTVSLASGTTAGNSVIIFFGAYAQTTGTVTGFTKRSPASANSARHHVFDRFNVGAGENNWTIGSGVSGVHSWIVVEVEGVLDYDVGASAIVNTSSGTTAATGTSASCTTYDGVALAFHIATDTGAAPALSGQTGGFAELAQHGHTGATKGVVVALSTQFTQSLGTFQSTATCSVTLDVTDPASAWVAVYSAQGAKRAANIACIWGGGIATVAGIATGTTGNAPFDGVTGSPAIVATTPEPGFCGSNSLELSASAAAENLTWLNTGALGLTAPLGSIQTPVERVCFQFPGALPAADLDVFSGEPGTNPTVIRYRSASGKIGVQIGAGTEQLSADVVAADTWYAVELRVDQRTTTYTGDWQLDSPATGPVGQAQVSLAGATAGLGLNALRLGWNSAQTGTVRYGFVLVSKIAGHYPLGRHDILPVTVDPAGTIALGGTAASTDFETYTSNGTTAAWNATTARDNIDEVPPTIGAAADGLCQVVADATAYVEIPLTTVQGAPDGAIRAVRLYFCGWAASTTAATVGFRDHDGTTEHTLLAAADPAFDNSTTTPAWVCRMAGATSTIVATWTQAKLDALVARVGFSTDASPKIGVHAVIGEAAVQTATAAEVVGQAGGLEVTQQVDPLTSGVLGVTATAPPEYPATLHLDVDGTPESQVVAAGTSYTRPVDAVDVGTVTRIVIEPDLSQQP